MRLLKWIYENKNHKEAPYYYNYSILKIIAKPLRKYITNVVAANCPFNCMRILLYRMCGFKIGKHCFIGMRCYLDDMCYDLMTIGNDCIISYGVYFACHGKNQKHLPITIGNNVYIGMRTNIISKSISAKGITIEDNAVIGACTLVNKDIPSGTTAVGIPCRILDAPEQTDE